MLICIEFVTPDPSQQCHCPLGAGAIVRSSTGHDGFYIGLWTTFCYLKPSSPLDRHSFELYSSHPKCLQPSMLCHLQAGSVLLFPHIQVLDDDNNKTVDLR